MNVDFPTFGIPTTIARTGRFNIPRFLSLSIFSLHAFAITLRHGSSPLPGAVLDLYKGVGLDYAFSMVSGPYDKGETDDAGEYKAGRSGDRAGGRKDSAVQPESGLSSPSTKYSSSASSIFPVASPASSMAVAS